MILNKKKIKEYIQDNLIFDTLNYFRKFWHLVNWKLMGSPVPPPHIVKQLAIRKMAQRFKANILIETGTYDGDMIYNQLHRFKKIVSIELNEELYHQAANRFKKHSHVKIVQGDSSQQLREQVKDLGEPAIFWLDGHYSGNLEGLKTSCGNEISPIYHELNAIKDSDIDNHIILIDDARCFKPEYGYPHLSELLKMIANDFSNHQVQIASDIIMVLPKK